MDRAFGGAGRDILIGNTGPDRLIDWAGNFNVYLLPFAPGTLGTVTSEALSGLPDFLYKLSRNDGGDPTTPGNPTRNGEPYGELGLSCRVTSPGATRPAGPPSQQAGTIPSGTRDVVRTSNFDDLTMDGFAATIGSWQVRDGRAAGERRPRRTATRPGCGSWATRCRRISRSSPR